MFPPDPLARRKKKSDAMQLERGADAVSRHAASKPRLLLFLHAKRFPLQKRKGRAWREKANRQNRALERFIHSSRVNCLIRAKRRKGPDPAHSASAVDGPRWYHPSPPSPLAHAFTTRWHIMRAQSVPQPKDEELKTGTLLQVLLRKPWVVSEPKGAKRAGWETNGKASLEFPDRLVLANGANNPSKSCGPG
ncbi:hypothetical protein VCV18_001201 [Metarhizium anisopliae]